ncbi:MAG: sugar transferase [Bacteroidota bacterium]
MSRRIELAALLASDATAHSAAYVAVLLTAAQWWSWPEAVALAPGSPYLVLAAGAVFWTLLFVLAGLYQERFAASRFDEVTTLVKVTAVGTLGLFFGGVLDALPPDAARTVAMLYGGTFIGLAALGRFAVRSIQKRRILAGYGRHRAVIVGWSDRVAEVHDEVARYPAAGLEIVGAVRLRRDEPELVIVGEDDRRESSGGDGSVYASSGDGLAFDANGLSEALHAIDHLPDLIDRLEVQDVLIALGSDDHVYLDEVLRVCDGKAVTLKLVPDFYAVVGGMARTEHMYGLPLIEVLPEPMSAVDRAAKRGFDLAVSSAILLAGLPLWILLGLAVRLTSKGPAIYRQVRTGQHGEPFTIYKFRTMVDGAERGTGPVWATKNDARITPLGAWLRKLRLDEVPQLWNVLKGEMSLVGPRPERPYFVRKLAAEIPLYRRRHRVPPGVTGLAQVKWGYDQSLDDVRQKLKYDLFYIENMSLGMDARILLQTIRTALTGKGQ